MAKKVDTQEAKLDNVTNEVAETNKTVKQIDEKVTQQETELNDLSDQVQEQKTDLKELRAEFAEAMIDIERIDRKVGWRNIKTQSVLFIKPLKILVLFKRHHDHPK